MSATAEIENLLADASDGSIARATRCPLGCCELKPLNWQKITDRKWRSAPTIGGSYAVVFTYGELPGGTGEVGGRWRMYGPNMSPRDCETVENGKRLCWEHHKTRVAELFESVD